VAPARRQQPGHPAEGIARVQQLAGMAEQLLPGRVSTGWRPLRSNRLTPRSISRLAMASLMVDWLLPRRRAAAENEPSSAAVLKAAMASSDQDISVSPMDFIF
jgi:hypothetical protein